MSLDADVVALDQPRGAENEASALPELTDLTRLSETEHEPE